MIHETTEQLEKAKDGLGPGAWSKTVSTNQVSPEFLKDHAIDITSENSVNGNVRNENTGIFTDEKRGGDTTKHIDDVRQFLYPKSKPYANAFANADASMKFNRLTCFFIILIECKSRQVATASCNENLLFKQKFYVQIEMVEKYTNERLIQHSYTVTVSDFIKSMNFIGRYTKTSISEIANYQIGYPNLESFENDKTSWIKWYEENKCKNIQL